MRSSPILFESTVRRLGGAGGAAFDRRVDFREALLLGQAPDGGLFMPVTLPSFDPADLRGWARLSYAEIAFRVLKPFVSGLIPDGRFQEICDDAYDFDVPVERLDDNLFVLRLDRGPTASFKDFAARWMARVMNVLRAPGEPLTVLVATSGDTGSAVGHAFRDLPGTSVFLLYPLDEVSPVQKRQLDTIGGCVRPLAVRGTFDQCQAVVKQAFLDPDLAGLGLTSANSINIGRILPQSVYYFYAWSRVCADGGPATFSVPSGNLGNSFGCETARRMGLPVERLILAVNANDAVPRFLATGSYEPVSPSRNCVSCAMNVGHPSNFARYVGAYDGVLLRDGTLRCAPDLAEMNARLLSVSVGDVETMAAAREAWRRYGAWIEPHGAVGLAAAWTLAPRRDRPVVCLETAHPAKFPEWMREAFGREPEPPPALRDLPARTEPAAVLGAAYADFKSFLRTSLGT